MTTWGGQLIDRSGVKWFKRGHLVRAGCYDVARSNLSILPFCCGCPTQRISFGADNFFVFHRDGIIHRFLTNGTTMLILKEKKNPKYNLWVWEWLEVQQSGKLSTSRMLLKSVCATEPAPNQRRSNEPTKQQTKRLHTRLGEGMT